MIVEKYIFIYGEDKYISFEKGLSGVYIIKNMITDDIYIGSSKNIRRRWNEHLKPSSWKKQPNSGLYQDMQKYGRDNFVIEILEEVAFEENLVKREQSWIGWLKPKYNVNIACWPPFDINSYRFILG